MTFKVKIYTQHSDGVEYRVRKLLRDDQWQRIEHGLPGKHGDPGRHAADNRLFLEAVLWIVRTGAPGARTATGVWALEQRIKALLAMGGEASGIACSRNWRRMPTSTSCIWIPLLCVPASMRLEQQKTVRKRLGARAAD